MAISAHLEQVKAFLNNPTRSLQLSRVTMLPVPALEGGVDGGEEVVYPERAHRRDGERMERQWANRSSRRCIHRVHVYARATWGRANPIPLERGPGSRWLHAPLVELGDTRSEC